GTPAFDVVAGTDLAAARRDVTEGRAVGAIALARECAWYLRFDLYTKEGSLSRGVQLVRQAAISIAVQDKLTRAGVSPIDQARLFTPPDFEIHTPDPNAPPALPG